MKTITVSERAQRTQIPLIDVRERDEYAAGHVPGAVNIPLSELGNRLHELPAEPFDVICERGGRSARVAEKLEARGHDVTNVDGGTSDWRDHGYEIVVPGR
ncbi:rhodanese-like domain-containing protein [Microbacterium sp. YY-01]|uniref:rhodanese-like domain-containing protein n=1 Tax=Microbacterium sp. YY-01 TaxID=3421634 RepID=UPI003D164F39